MQNGVLGRKDSLVVHLEEPRIHLDWRRLVDVREEIHCSCFDLGVTVNGVALEFHFINHVLGASDFCSKVKKFGVSIIFLQPFSP